MKHPHSIFITGANSGLGKELSLVYARKGVTLFLTARNLERLQDTAAQCKKKGATVYTKSLDITNSQHIADWILECNQTAPLDLVIANAGISAGTGGGGESPEQIKKIMSTNYDGVINTLSPATTHMQKRHAGHLVLVSSMAGLKGLPSSPAYSASKAAVRIYGDALRGILHKDNIHVTTIIPGYINTPMTQVNRFPMPFKLSATKAAKIIQKKLTSKPAYIIFPLSLYAIMQLLNHLPRCITDPLFARMPKKPNISSQNNFKGNP